MLVLIWRVLLSFKIPVNFFIVKHGLIPSFDPFPLVDIHVHVQRCVFLAQSLICGDGSCPQRFCLFVTLQDKVFPFLIVKEVHWVGFNASKRGRLYRMSHILLSVPGTLISSLCLCSALLNFFLSLLVLSQTSVIYPILVSGVVDWSGAWNGGLTKSHWISLYFNKI